MDKAHKQTDKRIERMEKKIHTLYVQRSKPIRKMLEKYLAKFQKEDEKQRELMERGEITPKEYENWRIKTFTGTREYKNLINAMSSKYTEILQEAIEEVNEEMASVYVLNYNFVGKDIERQVEEL